MEKSIKINGQQNLKDNMAKLLGKVGSISGIKATGAFIIVELLTAQEAAGTQIELGSNSKVPPQAYVVDIGPALKAEEWGIKVGDRVLLQGNFVPTPKIKDRMLGIVQAHDVKCVLLEDFD